MNKGKLLILSAPSGTGKTTVLKQVMTNVEGLAFSVSHTTRSPRKGETDGTDYHFVDHKTFLSMIEDGHFLEYAEVHGNFYGTSKVAINTQIDDGLDVILDIDVQGARLVRKSNLNNCVFIFLCPPELSVLEKRLRGRGLDNDETIATRLSNAQSEMEAMGEYEYLVVNDVLEEAVKMFTAIILAERSKARRTTGGKMIKSFRRYYEK